VAREALPFGVVEVDRQLPDDAVDRGALLALGLLLASTSFGQNEPKAHRAQKHQRRKLQPANNSSKSITWALWDTLKRLSQVSQTPRAELFRNAFARAERRWIVATRSPPCHP
jgi:hypothetical protein